MGLISKTIKLGALVVAFGAGTYYGNVTVQPARSIHQKGMSSEAYQNLIIDMYRQSDKMYDNGTSIMLDIMKEEGLERGRALLDRLKEYQR